MGEDNNITLEPFGYDRGHYLFLTVNKGDNGDFPEVISCYRLTQSEIDSYTQEQLEQNILQGWIFIINDQYYWPLVQYINGEGTPFSGCYLVSQNDSELIIAILYDSQDTLIVKDGEQNHIYSIRLSSNQQQK